MLLMGNLLLGVSLSAVASSCNSHSFLKQQLNPVYLFSNTCIKSFNKGIRTSCQFLHPRAVCPGPTGVGVGWGDIFEFLDTQSSSVKILPPQRSFRFVKSFL